MEFLSCDHYCLFKEKRIYRKCLMHVIERKFFKMLRSVRFTHMVPDTTVLLPQSSRRRQLECLKAVISQMIF